MPETKPREPQATSASGATGSSNGDSTPPEGSIEQVSKRRRFEQWVASVRPKAPPAKPNASSGRTQSAPAASAPSAANAITSPPPADHAEAAPDISVSSNPPPLMSTSPPPAGHAISNPPPSFFPIAQQRESDSTQLYQMVPADLLRKARDLQAPSEPPAPRPKRAPASAEAFREDPWATADERTAVFAPPPELLASVRAAAASAGLIPKDEVAGETSPPSGRITAEFDLQQPDPPSSAPQVEVASSHAKEVTKPTPAAETAEAPKIPSSSPPPAMPAVESQAEAAVSRPRWPWAVAVLVIAASLAMLAVRSHRAPAPVHPTNVGAPAR